MRIKRAWLDWRGGPGYAARVRAACRLQRSMRAWSERQRMARRVRMEAAKAKVRAAKMLLLSSIAACSDNRKRCGRALS